MEFTVGLICNLWELYSSCDSQASNLTRSYGNEITIVDGGVQLMGSH